MDTGIFIAVFAISGGLGVAYYAIWLDGKKRQLRHIERMAMIEKGIAPTAVADSFVDGPPSGPVSRRRQRTSGVFMICLGIALALMFGLGSGRWGSVWIGALIALIGVANVVNVLWDERDAQRQRPPNP